MSVEEELMFCTPVHSSSVRLGNQLLINTYCRRVTKCNINIIVNRFVNISLRKSKSLRRAVVV